MRADPAGTHACYRGARFPVGLPSVGVVTHCPLWSGYPFIVRTLEALYSELLRAATTPRCGRPLHACRRRLPVLEHKSQHALRVLSGGNEPLGLGAHARGNESPGDRFAPTSPRAEAEYTRPWLWIGRHGSVGSVAVPSCVRRRRHRRSRA